MNEELLSNAILRINNMANSCEWLLKNLEEMKRMLFYIRIGFGGGIIELDKKIQEDERLRE